MRKPDEGRGKRSVGTGFFVRPLRLKPRPVPIEVMAVYPDGPPLRFRWKDIDCQVAEWQGPERIETGWWRNELIRRDYYRVDTTSGHRFWLYRDRRDGTWSLQGEYA